MKKKPKVSKYGQWKYPGQVTTIPSNQITMQGVPYPVYGVDNTGYSQMMQPGGEYTFPGTRVTEYPIVQQGGDLSPEKAHQMLIDNSAHGKPLTDKQKRFFGYIYGKSKKMMGGTFMQNGGPTMTPRLMEATESPQDNFGYTVNPYNSNLVRGGKESIQQVQKMLNDHGANLKEDGAWGPKTQKAWEKYIGKSAKKEAAPHKKEAAPQYTGTMTPPYGGTSVYGISPVEQSMIPKVVRPGAPNVPVAGFTPDIPNGYTVTPTGGHSSSAPYLSAPASKSPLPKKGSTSKAPVYIPPQGGYTVTPTGGVSSTASYYPTETKVSRKEEANKQAVSLKPKPVYIPEKTDVQYGIPKSVPPAVQQQPQFSLGYDPTSSYIEDSDKAYVAESTFANARENFGNIKEPLGKINLVMSNSEIPNDVKERYLLNRKNPSYKSNYFITSKTIGKTYQFDKNHNLIGVYPSLTGMNPGNFVNTSDPSASKESQYPFATSPKGTYVIKDLHKDPETFSHYGTPFAEFRAVGNTPADYTLGVPGIHGVLKSEYKARMAAIDDPDPRKHCMSYGCTNLKPWDYYKANPAIGDSVYITDQSGYQPSTVDMFTERKLGGQLNQMAFGGMGEHTTVYPMVMQYAGPVPPTMAKESTLTSIPHQAYLKEQARLINDAKRGYRVDMNTGRTYRVTSEDFRNKYGYYPTEDVPSMTRIGIGEAAKIPAKAAGMFFDFNPQDVINDPLHEVPKVIGNIAATELAGELGSRLIRKGIKYGKKALGKIKASNISPKIIPTIRMKPTEATYVYEGAIPLKSRATLQDLSTGISDDIRQSRAYQQMWLDETKKAPLLSNASQRNLGSLADISPETPMYYNTNYGTIDVDPEIVLSKMKNYKLPYDFGKQLRGSMMRNQKGGQASGFEMGSDMPSDKMNYFLSWLRDTSYNHLLKTIPNQSVKEVNSYFQSGGELPKAQFGDTGMYDDMTMQDIQQAQSLYPYQSYMISTGRNPNIYDPYGYAMNQFNPKPQEYPNYVSNWYNNQGIPQQPQTQNASASNPWMMHTRPDFFGRWVPNTASPNFYQVRNPQALKDLSSDSYVSGINNPRYGIFNTSKPGFLGKRVNKFDITIKTPKPKPFTVATDVTDTKYPISTTAPAQEGMTELSGLKPAAGTQTTYGNVNRSSGLTGTSGYNPEKDPKSPMYEKETTLKAGRKNWRDRWWANPDVFNAGVNLVTGAFNNAEANRQQAWLRRQTAADNVYTAVRGSRGDYTPNYGYFRPNEMVPVQFPGAAGFAQYGGQYQQGGEYDLTQEEIDQILANGGKIDYLD